MILKNTETKRTQYKFSIILLLLFRLNFSFWGPLSFALPIPHAPTRLLDHPTYRPSPLLPLRHGNHEWAWTNNSTSTVSTYNVQSHPLYTHAEKKRRTPGAALTKITRLSAQLEKVTIFFSHILVAVMLLETSNIEISSL